MASVSKNIENSALGNRKVGMTSTLSFLDSQRGKIQVADYEEELQFFLTEITNSVIAKEHSKNQSNSLQDSKLRDVGMSFSIMREVVRTEIRTISTLIQEGQRPDGSTTQSAQQATVSALKRKVKEALDELEKLKHEKKLLEIDNRDLQDEVAAMSRKLSEQQESVRDAKSLRRELESKIDLSQHTISALKADRKRLEKYVSNLRSEINEYQNIVSERELRDKQARRYIQQLENRILELKNSESALTDRVNDILDVHRENLLELKRVIDAKDLPGALKAFNVMSSRLSQGAGKFRVRIRRRNLQPTDGNEDGPSSARKVRSMRTRAEGESSEDSPANSNEPTDTAKQPRRLVEEASSAPRSSIFSRLSRRSPIHAVSGTGEENGENDARLFLTRAEKQRTYEKGLLQSREDAKRNCEVLEQIVSSKNSEIYRLEEELKSASEQVSALEKECLAATMMHRKENRNVHLGDDRELNKLRDQRKPQSLFDWYRFNDDTNDEAE